MSVEVMDVQTALERGVKLPCALVRSLSAVSLGPVPAEISTEDLLEARFFSAEEEIRLFRRDGTLRAARVADAPGEIYADQDCEIANPALGAGITVRTFMEFDGDGQAYWGHSRLKDWRGGAENG